MGRRQRNRARRQLTAAMPGAPQRYGCDEAPDLRDGLDGGLLAGLEAGTLVQLAARRSWGLGWLVITNPTGAPNPIRKGPLQELLETKGSIRTGPPREVDVCNKENWSS